MWEKHMTNKHYNLQIIARLTWSYIFPNFASTSQLSYDHRTYKLPPINVENKQSQQHRIEHIVYRHVQWFREIPDFAWVVADQSDNKKRDFRWKVTSWERVSEFKKKKKNSIRMNLKITLTLVWSKRESRWASAKAKIEQTIQSKS